jgi:hypothetical protein
LRSCSVLRLPQSDQPTQIRLSLRLPLRILDSGTGVPLVAESRQNE